MDYKAMFEQAVRTLALIDEALGIGEDGCGEPEQTLDAIARLKSQISILEASPMSEEALDILRAENKKLKDQAKGPCPTCQALARTVMMDQTGLA